MAENQKNEKKKKGVLAAIWESMTKTGGCGCSDGSCCGSSQPNSGNEKIKKNPTDPIARDAVK